MRREVLDGWCILRTAGPRTLAMVKWLTAAGLDVWTPSQTISVRRPRSKERIEREAPIMPTFAFARSHHIPELQRIMRSPVSHPQFSIFQHDGGFPIIGDRDIASLRAAEDRAKVSVLKKQRHVFPIGQNVTVPESSFAGMTGVVEQGDGKFALVCFGGSFRVKIATFLLRTDEVHRVPAITGTAARAAAS